MVGNDAHGNVLLPVCAVGRARLGGDGLHEGLEHVSVVVGCFPLYSHAEAFKAHAGVNHAGGQGFQRAVAQTVVLHEHQIPYLYHLWMVFVYQLPARHGSPFVRRTKVNVNLGAGTAGTGVPHFPEVVFLVTV
ncbi:hypothetical protein Barb4_03668 [Bacteroidales bacterium Barb4]|nr:hypothetical protein Barb4_03668 [Bacteroidales bacterium Barb4]